MYSIVLMAALSTSAAEPACHWGCGFRAHGCHGCYGSCYGRACHGCYGCSGCYGCYGGCYGYGYGYSCAGCYGCWGARSNYAPIYMEQQAPEKIPAPKKDVKEPPKEDLGQARIIIDVPQGAKLFIDGKQMKTEGSKRVFRTPTLNATQTYYYEVKTEVVRDGKTYTDSKRLVFRAGQDVTASFQEPVIATAAKTEK